LAAETDRSPTMPGTIALHAELSIPLSAAVTAGNRNSGHSTGPKSAFSASPALASAAIASTAISIRRRSTASTSDPPNSDPKISGNSCASDTSPTYSDECVSPYTWYGTETVVSWVPRVDTPSPPISARKSADRRSGVRSRKTCLVSHREADGLIRAPCELPSRSI
jgi:hypothetical protein